MNFFKKIFKGNTLYYPGCLTKFVLGKILNNYKEILKNEGIDYIMLNQKELCCGSPLKSAGKDNEFKELVKKNFKIFKEHGVSKIITNCPACAAIFIKDYKEIEDATRPILVRKWGKEEVDNLFSYSAETLTKG